MSSFPSNNFFLMRKETVFRNADAQISTTKAVRLPDSWEASVKIPVPRLETKDAHEGGSETPNQEIPLSFLLGETGPEFYAVVPGVWWYYVMGACTTTGTDTATIARDVTNVAGQVVTFDGAAVVASVYEPATGDLGTYVCWCTVGTHAGEFWYISDNGANTLTLLGTVPGTLLTDTIKVIGPPYTHAITRVAVGTALPSFTLHRENEDWTYYRDYVGCYVEALTFKAPQGGPCTNNPTIKAAKDIAGANHTIPSPRFHTDTRMSYHKHCNTLTITYDSDNIDDVTELRNWIDDIEITAENTLDRGNQGGDQHAKAPVKGAFKVTVKIRYRMQGYELWTIRNTEIGSYTTALAHVYKFQRSANDYIQFTIDKSKVTGDAQEDTGDIEGKEIFEPFEFILSPEATPGTLVIEVKDNYSWAHYEDGAE